MHHPVVKAMVAIIGQTIDFQAVFSTVMLKERKISNLTVYNMISLEKINFCAIVSRWISLKAARSKGSKNFWQRVIDSFCSSTYTLSELTLKQSSAWFGHGIPEFPLTRTFVPWKWVRKLSCQKDYIEVNIFQKSLFYLKHIWKNQKRLDL